MSGLLLESRLQPGVSGVGHDGLSFAAREYFLSLAGLPSLYASPVLRAMLLGLAVAVVLASAGFLAFYLYMVLSGRRSSSLLEGSSQFPRWPSWATYTLIGCVALLGGLVTPLVDHWRRAAGPRSRRYADAEDPEPAVILTEEHAYTLGGTSSDSSQQLQKQPRTRALPSAAARKHAALWFRSADTAPGQSQASEGPAAARKELDRWLAGSKQRSSSFSRLEASLHNPFVGVGRLLGHSKESGKTVLGKGVRSAISGWEVFAAQESERVRSQQRRAALRVVAGTPERRNQVMKQALRMA